jgi:hypothetical protein
MMCKVGGSYLGGFSFSPVVVSLDS